jgi:hypothetical protein
MHVAVKVTSRVAVFMSAWLLSFSLVRCAGLQLTPAQQAAVDLFECRVRALEPYVGEMYDTADLVRQFSTDDVELGKMLISLGYELPVVLQVADNFRACQPEVTTQPLVAPPPQPGGKVL